MPIIIAAALAIISRVFLPSMTWWTVVAIVVITSIIMECRK